MELSAGSLMTITPGGNQRNADTWSRICMSRARNFNANLSENSLANQSRSRNSLNVSLNIKKRRVEVGIH